MLHALSSSLSDHCPLLLADDKGPRRPRTFKFENFWASMPGFSDVVQKAWNERVDHTDPYIILFHKLKKTALHLSEWSRCLFLKAKVHLQAALLAILRLDIAQEERQLSPEELGLDSRRESSVWPCLRKPGRNNALEFPTSKKGMPTQSSYTVGSMQGGERTISIELWTRMVG